MTITKQSLSSITRQVLAVAVTVYTVIATNTGSLHLPVALSSILTAIGPIVIAIEHYVGDPSTGTPSTPASAVETPATPTTPTTSPTPTTPTTTPL